MPYDKDMDCRDLVDFDKDLKKYSESFIFEAESTALEYIERFENDTFLDQLISRLAQRNTLTEHKVNTIHDIETEELFTAISSAENKWRNELDEFGLSRIDLNKTQFDTAH